MVAVGLVFGATDRVAIPAAAIATGLGVNLALGKRPSEHRNIPIARLLTDGPLGNGEAVTALVIIVFFPPAAFCDSRSSINGLL